MGQKYARYSQEFRDSALRRLALAPNVAQLCRELGISRQLLYFSGGTAAAGRREAATGRRATPCVRKMLQFRKALLKRTLEVDFFKAACAKVEALRPSGTGSGVTASGK